MFISELTNNKSVMLLFVLTLLIPVATIEKEKRDKNWKKEEKGRKVRNVKKVGEKGIREIEWQKTLKINQPVFFLA